MRFTESFLHIYYVIWKIHFYRTVLYTYSVFDAVCVSVCGPCVDRRSVFQHLAAGVLVCRENHPEPLCHSSLGRTGPPPYLDPSPRPGCCFLNSPGAPFFWVPNPGCSLFSCRQRQLGPPDLSWVSKFGIWAPFFNLRRDLKVSSWGGGAAQFSSSPHWLGPELTKGQSQDLA